MTPQNSSDHAGARQPRGVARDRARPIIKALGLFSGTEPIRARTLIALRWVALSGQAAAALGASVVGARFPLLPVLLVILGAAALNLALSRRGGGRATERETLAHLLFDLLQAGLLLTLTGGIANPFALFVLVPLIIGATFLPRRSMTVIAAATAAMVIVMAVTPLPLTFSERAPISSALAVRLGHLLALAIGGAFVTAYLSRISSDLADTTAALAAAQLGLAREQRLQHLGGVVAAAAHEMGTPLATIKLIAGELADELADRPEIGPDLALLRSSADRCRDILRSMGTAGKDDLLLHSAPLADVLIEAAGPHRERGIAVAVTGDAVTLIVQRDAGLIHALRNLIQNAVDFAVSRVELQAQRTGETVTVSIRDDGPGYPPALIARLGEPFLTTRPTASYGDSYEGMGLGLFIARTLLERGGGRLRFFNQDGAVAQISWPERALVANNRAALGANPAIAG